MAVEIPISGGLFALVDESDAEDLARFKWAIQRTSTNVYAVCSQRGRTIMMHRQIMGTQGDEMIDHKDGNGLNNQRSNLRPCTNTQNVRNQRKHRDGRSRFKGVTLKSEGRWSVQIVHDGDQIRLGTFDDEVRAARQYDRAARLLFKEFARTNEDLGLFEGCDERPLSRPRKIRKPAKRPDRRWQNEMARIGVVTKMA